jgi:hypothetical protein
MAVLRPAATSKKTQESLLEFVRYANKTGTSRAGRAYDIDVLEFRVRDTSGAYNIPLEVSGNFGEKELTKDFFTILFLMGFEMPEKVETNDEIDLDALVDEDNSELAEDDMTTEIYSYWDEVKKAVIEFTSELAGNIYWCRLDSADYGYKVSRPFIGKFRIYKCK